MLVWCWHVENNWCFRCLYLYFLKYSRQAKILISCSSCGKQAKIPHLRWSHYFFLLPSDAVNWDFQIETSVCCFHFVENFTVNQHLEMNLLKSRAAASAYFHEWSMYFRATSLWASKITRAKVDIFKSLSCCTKSRSVNPKPQSCFVYHQRKEKTATT